MPLTQLDLKRIDFPFDLGDRLVESGLTEFAEFVYRLNDGSRTDPELQKKQPFGIFPVGYVVSRGIEVPAALDAQVLTLILSIAQARRTADGTLADSIDDNSGVGDHGDDVDDGDAAARQLVFKATLVSDKFSYEVVDRSIADAYKRLLAHVAEEHGGQVGASVPIPVALGAYGLTNKHVKALLESMPGVDDCSAYHMCFCLVSSSSR